MSFLMNLHFTQIPGAMQLVFSEDSTHALAEALTIVRARLGIIEKIKQVVILITLDEENGLQALQYLDNKLQ